MADDSDWNRVFRAIRRMDDPILVKNFIDAGLNLTNKDGRTILSEAVGLGNIDVVKYLINKGADINIKNSNGSNSLHVAVNHGYTKIAKYLFESGISIDSRDDKGNTCLHYVAESRDGGGRFSTRDSYQEIVHFLLNENVELEAVNNIHCTPLLLACANGHKDLVELFIRLGANVHCCEDECQTTVLFHACWRGWLGIARNLIEEFHVNLNAQNILGDTPLTWSCKLRQRDIVELLVDSGADIPLGAVPVLKGGRSLLHAVCGFGKMETVKYLVGKGCDIHAKDDLNNQPLHIAASYPTQLSVIEYLVDIGADINSLGKYGMTSLLYASWEGLLDVVKVLVNKGCELNTKSTQCKDLTPLLFALVHNHVRVAEYLIDSGADVNCCDRDNLTPLHIACKKGFLEIVKSLVEKGCDMNIKCLTSERTPLLTAIIFRHFNFIEFLVDSGAEINCCDNTSKTPLQYICQEFFGHFRRLSNIRLNILKHMLKAGADCNVQDARGISAFGYALENPNCLEVVALFLDKGAYVSNKDYIKVVNHQKIKKAILEDPKLCTVAIQNKYSAELAKIYDKPSFSKCLPSFKKEATSVITKSQKDIAHSVKYDIQRNSYCNLMKIRPINLGILCLESIAKYHFH